MDSSEHSVKVSFQETFKHVTAYFRWIVLCLGILYFLSGIYSVSSNEIGIIQRFGRVIDDKVQPGIHYALPWPVDKVTKVPIRMVSRILIDDFYSAEGSDSIARVFTEMTGLDSYCVTGDNNLVNVMCVIQFNITDPFKYIFLVDRPNTMLRSIACTTIIHCLAGMPIDEALTRGKQGIANYISDKLQKRLDDSQCGLSVFFVELRDIKPPDRVQEFFSDVIKAKIDYGKMINEAELYRNEKLPAAGADATRIRQEAEAYKREVVLRAEGQAARFTKLLRRVQKNGDSARKMLYIEYMKDIVKNIGKKHVLVRDTKGQVPAQLRLYSPP